MRQLGIFAKYWQPGAVKTRLAADIGERPASRLYQAFLRVLVERFRAVADRRVIVFAPDTHRASFAQLAGESWLLSPQGGGDLGERLKRYFRCDREATENVLIGSDSPTLPQRFVAEAFEALKTHEVVVGPSEDGGYYLIGGRHVHPGLFHDIQWSSPQVWAQTEARLRQLGVDFATLPAWYDVDELDDLKQLERELRTQQADPLWRTLHSQVISAIGHLPLGELGATDQ